MPTDYPIEQLLQEMMATIQDGTPYIIPAAIMAGTAAFIIRWFMIAVNFGDWAFGSRR